MKAKFSKDSKGETRWTLSADNGEPLAVSSEGYVSEYDAVRGFELTTGAQVLANDQGMRVVALATGSRTIEIEGL